MNFQSLHEFNCALNQFMSYDGHRFGVDLGKIKRIGGTNLFPFVEITARDIIESIGKYEKRSIISLEIDFQIAEEIDEPQNDDDFQFFETLMDLDILKFNFFNQHERSDFELYQTCVYLVHDFGILLEFYSDLTLLISNFDIYTLREKFNLGTLIDYSIRNSVVIDVKPPILELMAALSDGGVK